jgi:HAE1 family hydrophobic/amphiphilic exporter-1
MTSAALVAGAIPTALGIHLFGSGAGSEFRRGLAWVIVGGVTTSTLLTLLVVPTVYSLLDSAVTRFMGLFRRDGGAGSQPAAQPTAPVAQSAAASTTQPVETTGD